MWEYAAMAHFYNGNKKSEKTVWKARREPVPADLSKDTDVEVPDKLLEFSVGTFHMCDWFRKR